MNNAEQIMLSKNIIFQIYTKIKILYLLNWANSGKTQGRI